MKSNKPNSQGSRLWQFLIAAKLTILLGLALAQSGWLQFGDMPLFAKGEKSEAGSSQDGSSENGKDEGAAAAKSEGSDKDKSKDKVADKPAEDAKKPEKSRQSFLSNLLELPPLNTDNMKKEELGRYLDIAERKKRQIEERLSNLGRREEQLKSLEQSIDNKLKKLDDERKYFAETIQKEKDLKGERLDKLVTLYSKMEPKKAAAVVEKLDKDLVVELFKQLPQKQVTAILEGMPADKSVSISEYYGRVRSMREYDILKEMNQSLRKEFEECKGVPKA